MRAGIWNLLFGLVAVAAGASGKFVLPFTTSPLPLMVLGGAIASFGAYQLWRDRAKPT